MRFIGESVSGGDRRHRSDHTTMVNQAAGRWGGGGSMKSGSSYLDYKQPLESHCQMNLVSKRYPGTVLRPYLACCFCQAR